MNVLSILQQVVAAGVALRVIDGRLMGNNLRILDVDTREALRGNKAEITNLLMDQSGFPFDSSTLEVVPELKPCCLCHGRDFIHGDTGGYFCITCQPQVRIGVPVKAGGYRSKKYDELQDERMVGTYLGQTKLTVG